MDGHRPDGQRHATLGAISTRHAVPHEEQTHGVDSSHRVLRHVLDGAMKRDIIRRVRFTPYKAMQPTFTLTMWDTGRINSMGKWMVGYRLTMCRSVFTGTRYAGRKSVVLFEGEDFGCSPLHAIDSNATVEGVMG